MNLDIKHYGRIINGRKEYFNFDLYNSQLRQLEGKEFIEIIKQRHIKPSNDQHGYYRGGILITCHKSEMFSHMDNKDEIHDDYFAPKFLSYVKIVTIGNKTIEQQKVRSLSDLSKDEMTEFVQRVISCCESELDLRIPAPEEYYNKYYTR